MGLIIAGVLLVVVLAAVLVRWTRVHPVAVIVAFAVLLSAGVLVAMVSSVVTTGEAALIAGVGMFLLGAALAAPGALAGAAWRRKATRRPVAVR